MNIDVSKLFRERLRTLREAKGLNQGELEERIGKETNYISRVETGRIDTPPIEVMGKIAEALDVPLYELFFFEGLDDNAEVLREKIQVLLNSSDAEHLRKFYRLMLVSLEQ
jgi:transcriptional regulator with XRE-family HTH domain